MKYTRFLQGAIHGDLGTSYFFKRPALEVILDKLVATLELVFGATLLIIFVSIPLGVYSAIRPRSMLTKFIMATSSIGISIPVFLTAIMLMYVFSIQLGWLPAYGRGETANVLGWDSGFFTWDGIKHLILPSIALSSIMLPLFIRLVRSEMLEQLSSEYVKFARAKGLNDHQVYYRHALKNTMLPVITVGGVQIGTMVAYTILTESVFQWPGTGFLFWKLSTAWIPR
ncbi:ABC transporter permease [Plesiomonas shigelloides subsp. oncorhynchi]|nr:ABC transporter permease [Plesiomonas shigelloides]